MAGAARGSITVATTTEKSKAKNPMTPIIKGNRRGAPEGNSPGPRLTCLTSPGLRCYGEHPGNKQPSECDGPVKELAFAGRTALRGLRGQVRRETAPEGTRGI